MQPKEIPKLVNRLKIDYHAKKFNIQKESDIVCYLYYLLKQKYPNNNLIFTEFKTNELLLPLSGKSKRRGRFDLVVLKGKFDGKYQDNIIDTAFEIKYDYNENCNLADFREIFWEDDRKLTSIKNHVKNKVIILFNHNQFDGMDKLEKFRKGLKKKGIVLYSFFDK